MREDKISKVLGVRSLTDIDEDETPVSVIEEPSVPVVASDINDENLKDIDQARCNVKNIIEQGDDALKEMIDLAKQSESPRAFEVTATLMKTLLDANKDFVEMSTKKKYATEEKTGTNSNSQQNVTNNNLILSTTDLLKMIKGEQDG